MMTIATTICVIFILVGIANQRERKRKVFLRGEDATVHIDFFETMEKDVLEVTFSDYTSKHLVQHVLIYDQRKNQTENISMMKNYASRINWIEINNGSLSFILLNVNFMDSGHYMAYQDSVVKGKTSIHVARHRVLVQDGLSITLPFLCNVTNVTSIKIELMLNTLQFFVVKYDVTQANCTEVGNLYVDRIDSCALTDNNFSLTLRRVSYLDVGIYVAWDDMDFLIDSVFVEVAESNKQSSTERPHGYFNSSFVTNTASSDAEHEAGVRLLFAAVGVAVTVPLTVASTLLILWRRGSFQFTCMGPDLKTGPISKISTDSAAVDESEYEEPRINETELSIYLEPIGIATAHMEDNNQGGTCSKAYEKLHPYENQGLNKYSSLRAEHILEVSNRPFI